MIKSNFKNNLLNFFVVFIIFLIDRLSKIYILKIAELNDSVNIYINSYLNIYLIWYEGIAFGLLAFKYNAIYNLISLLIICIIIVITIMLIKAKGFKRYALILTLGGAIGNLFDRVYYKAVPDFIDLHYGNFHWFVFNVADIFITVGIVCLIYDEIFYNKACIKNENSI